MVIIELLVELQMKNRVNKSQQALNKTCISSVMQYFFHDSYIWFILMQSFSHHSYVVSPFM